VALRHRPQLRLHLKGQPVDVKQVAQELGVRYLLEGSVRKAGNRVRITGQLIDTRRLAILALMTRKNRFPSMVYTV
jgi:TolB-like protein